MRREGLRRRAVIGAMALALLAAAVGVVGRAGDEASAGGETSESSPAPVVGSLLAEAPVDDEVRGLVAAMGSGAAGQTGRLSELPAAEEAERVLDEYAARGDCVVARSGWLDLLGRTWGCVIQGEGWVDVCVVGEREGGGSEVGVMRMDASGLRGEGGG